MSVVVIGGGFVGQLVQLLIPDALVLDRAAPPKDHMETRKGPQYLWEPIEHPQVEMRGFTVVTTVDGHPPTLQSIRRYKQKVGKIDDGGDWQEQFKPQRMGWECNLPTPRIQYDTKIRWVDLKNQVVWIDTGEAIRYDKLVNTISLPVFLKMTDPTEFDKEYLYESRAIYMRSLKVARSSHKPEATMFMDYIANPESPIYRVTTQHGLVHFESMFPFDGHDDQKRISPGKIYPNNFSEAVIESLQSVDCHCFGRFATWRPDELAHQTWANLYSWVRSEQQAS